MNIITVTLNPAYDIHCTVTDFVPFAENYAEAVSRSCGGKGINISKMLNELSVSNEACVVLGRENAAYFEEYLKNYRCKKFYTNGAIRENITVHSPEKKETRISADSFSVSPKLFSEVSDYILSRSGSGAIVAFSGRLPRGAEKNAVLKFFERLQNSGALLSLDSNSFSAEELIRLSLGLLSRMSRSWQAFGAFPPPKTSCAVPKCCTEAALRTLCCHSASAAAFFRAEGSCFGLKFRRFLSNPP